MVAEPEPMNEPIGVKAEVVSPNGDLLPGLLVAGSVGLKRAACAWCRSMRTGVATA